MTQTATSTPSAPRPLDPGGWAPYLDPGEHLLWEGAPNSGLRFKPSDIFLSLFGAVFGGFALFWMFMASGMGDAPGPIGFIFPLFGLPFLAVGAYLVGGRFFWDSWMRSRTRYALTNRRGMVARQAMGRSLKSYPIDGGTDLDYRPGHEATIYFAREERRGKNGTYTVQRGFEYIPDGEEVYRLLRLVQQGGAAALSGELPGKSPGERSGERSGEHAE